MFVGNSCFFLELSKLKYALSHTKEASKPKLDWNVLFCNWHVVHSIVIYAKIKLLRNHQLFSFITVWGQDSTNFAPGISILVEYLIQDFVSV